MWSAREPVRECEVQILAPPSQSMETQKYTPDTEASTEEIESARLMNREIISYLQLRHQELVRELHSISDDLTKAWEQDMDYGMELASRRVPDLGV